ncbi:N-acetylglucosamine/diacetylchitobiose ABC transporter substrate-binding protein [Actinoplanes sp. NBRC 103695]|uniref:N-acetylglucosamine/diacetylchitobiose ABC transporter substrate-binding protein n=1 Tax=Actinoplanes sp. NBRC 103695 TaxID=3032202 RepID=UPI0024A1188B|nr:N-acetylglucosamine/diacetylchitobiose ABC transporter substrate-binding protein [Actinoplanes sp. NBRC 103695]GLY93700.1 carbohydrate ABC transporter, N-acetylglucosamine/diacetylchitobiose-binding protein [Actinoplanes sp. NBRC 103695]
MSDIFARPEVDRRTLLRRAAAVGLMATPAAGLLSACVGGGEEKTQDQAEGTKSDTNPLGVDAKAPLEVIIFNGGLGSKYATDVHIPSYKKAFPTAEVKFSETQEIGKVVQPRINAGDPPDMVNNAGAGLMDMAAIVKAGQAQDLTDLFAAPSVDIPGKTVKDTLVPGAYEQGLFDGKPYVLNYAFTVYGLWYNKALFTKNNWTLPKTWAEFTTLLGTIKAAGVTPFAYAGANAPYYMYLAILTSAAKIGGTELLKALDENADGAWEAPAIKQAAAAWAEIGAKFSDKKFKGLRHTEVQLQQNQDKVAFYPCGSWLENEQAKDTPAGFEYAVIPLPSVTGADKLPQTAIYAAAGEMYYASSKGKNPRGGMEYLRHMLSKEGAAGFTKLTKVLTVVQGAADGLTISPGLTSGNELLKGAGSDFFGYRWPDLYKKLDVEVQAATNQLMFDGGTADQFVTRIAKVAKAV